MHWMQELKNKFSAQVSHFFILYLNVADNVHYKDTLISLEDYLLLAGPSRNDQSVDNNAGFIAYFNIGTGIRFPNSEKERQFREFLTDFNPALAKLWSEAPREVTTMLAVFNELLRVSWDSENKKIRESLARIFGDYQKNIGKPFFTAIIEYSETIAPPEEKWQLDRIALVTFEVWAKSQKIRKANNLIILVTENLNAIAAALRSEYNDLTPLKIPFPNEEERLLVIQKARKNLGGLTSELEEKILADLTSGLTNKILYNLLVEYAYHKRPLTSDAIFQTKKKFLEEQAQGFLEIVKPVWGLEAIGSLEEHKLYIAEVVRAMKNQNSPAVPMGILLLGPPGVGKTVFAEAIAHEAGIPMMKLKNIREKWVGQSERNLDFILELIKAYAPAIVFVDEIDQQFQSRGTVFHGDSGVSARLQAKIFEFMSDTNLRGKILWIAASNRPDLLDHAMLREGRFDEKIPFFPPAPEERAKILEAILKKKESLARADNKVFSWNLSLDFIHKFGWLAHCHQDPEEGLIPCDERKHPFGEKRQDEITFTGAEIEAVVTKAQLIASRDNADLKAEHLLEVLNNDFLVSRDLKIFNQMIDLALIHCGSEKFIPEEWKSRSRRLRARPEGTNRLNL